MNLSRDQFSIIIFLLLLAGYEAVNNDEEAHAQDEANEFADLDYRLPKTIVPTNYEIILVPELQNDFKFEGIVHISAYLRNSTNTITLHHGRLDINLVSVTVDAQNEIIDNTTYNNMTEKYEIKLNRLLKEGTNIMINFDYTGKLRDDMIGFYRSSYFDSEGQIRWLAATQFQTTHARHAFPCFDEPSFKATYDIRILRPAEYTCLSNMPLNKSIPYMDKYWDQFTHSIPMSTYLVAFIISDFNYTNENNFIKVWAKPNAVDQTKFALNIGTKGLVHLSERFKQDYQLPKMDMVAVPDFSAGAMENWGLVTYRESRLLYDEESTSDAAKQSIASVIIHELTHMWFGNMITPEWWGYLWLSEGFARYFQYFATAQIETSWNMENQFLVEQHQTAFAADGIETSLPMTRTVVNLSQISNVGDTITYNKGASILRMINLVFGSDVFDATLQNYLANNAEGKVARPIDFWKELENEYKDKDEALSKYVGEIMATWTEQAGFPVLSVIIEDGKVLLKQERFLLRNLKSTPTNLTWWIPVTWATQQNPNFHQLNVHWMNNQNDLINIDKSTGWVIFNVQSAGFYRVNYDKASWYRIIDALNSDEYEKINVLNRAALIDDLLNLARADLLDYQTAFDGLRYLTREKNYLPFKAAFSALTYLDQRLSGQNEYKQFKEFVLFLIENAYKDIGYVDRPSDNRLTVLLRGELNKWACNYGHETCVQTFTKMFQQWTKYNSTQGHIIIKPNQRPVAYCTGVKYGTKEDWEFLWHQYYNSNSATDQIVMLEALGCTQDKTLLEKHLLNVLKKFEENRIRLQDHTAVFSAVYGSNIFGAEFVLDFVTKHQAEMIKFYNGTGTVSSILSSASKRFSTERLVDKYDSLIKAEFKDIVTSLNSSLELARYELQWLKRHTKAITSWINDFNSISYRLPTSIIPNSYTIWIKTNLTDLDNFTFTGSVNIETIIAKKTKNITLHLVDLIYENISLSADNKQISYEKTSINKKYDFLVIHLSEELQPRQRLNISIEFTGRMNEEEMRGIYRSWYLDDKGEKKWLAATHMEPVGARKMFPCFDEPEMKAYFTINVLIPQKYNAISNTPMKRPPIYLKDNMQSISFEETPKMSTYLVALVISDFSMKNDTDRYKVWARQNAVENGGYALSLMKPLLSYYEGTLNSSYHREMHKLDMVALPDFVSGAMENWGLLTYKERNLLFDENLSTTASKQSIANVVAHEIAHQWFGNLVSPKWWKYLWLNEGFARYFQYFAIHEENSGWSLEGQFVVEQVHSALEVDSSESTHPMTHDVWSPTQIRGIFDTISYAKAASVLRMIENVLTKSLFHMALQIYLDEQKYGAATPEDLFNAISKTIEDEELRNLIPDIMNSWTTQSGYPVVHATQNGSYLLLKQERFFLDPEESLKTENFWHIPITWTNLNKPDFSDTKTKHWFKNAEESFILSTSDLLLLNVRQAGFYRVNYSPENWQRINEILNDRYRSIDEINRATIIDDLFNLARAKYVGYPTLLTATEYLVKEDAYLPWRAFFNGLSYLHKQFEGKGSYKAFVRYVSSLLTPIYEKLELKDNHDLDHTVLLLKSHVLKWACKLDILDCKSKTLAQFEAWNNKSTTDFPPNIRSVAYCTVAEQNNRKSWDRLWELYEQSTFSAEKFTILQALACTTEDTFLEELLENALSKDKVRFEDSSSVFTSVINAGPKGVKFVIKFVKMNYEKMLAHFKQASNINSILNTIGKNVFTKELVERYVDLVNFLEEKEVTKEAKAYRNHAQQQLKWGEENIPQIFHWMEKRYPSMDYRLPNTFKPSKYNLTLSPDFASFTFAGRVQIEMKCHVEAYVSHIMLHASDLHVTGLSLRAKNSNLDDENQRILETIQNNKTQMITIFMAKLIQSDELVLDITFEGILNDNMAGFYRSYYFDEYGNIHWLATTQFQPTHARKAFPCFDEPAFKAQFTISVERPDNYNVLSNMKRVKLISSNSPDRSIDVFEESKNMSTYLVAFIVSDFEPVTNADVPLNVWGRRNIVSKGSRAKDIAIKVRDFLETNHTYTLPKLDLVGIPDMGDIGAMENWGLITFREYGLFYDEDVTTTKQLDYIITIIAHELAHSMFGNLVTCDWWEYIWLNEGFAQYMQWRLGALYAPNNGYEELFVVDELQTAMQEDALSTSHPMNNPVSTPNEIKRAFDSIAYKKSASVIRMLQKSLEPEVFERAVSTYLENNKFSTAKPNDLWQAFTTDITNDQQRGPKNVSQFMFGWTNTRGYPVVFADKSDDGTITLSQKSFSTYEDTKDFWIPITVTTATERNFLSTAVKTWLQGDYEKISIDLSPDKWFILNIQQSGYYRVNYDTESWKLLIKALNSDHTVIHVANRAQIVDDLLNLARAGWVDYEIVLQGTTYLLEEHDYVPWKAFFNGMSFLLQRYQGQNGEDLLKKYILLLAKNVYMKLGFDDVKEESHLDKLNRELILSWMCKLNHTHCVETSTRKFAEWHEGKIYSIPPDTKAAIYCTAIRNRDPDDWYFLWDQYQKTNFASEKKIILDALGCSTDKKILYNYIDKALKSNYTGDIRKQDFNAVLASIYNSGECGVNTMLDFVVNYHERLREYYGNWNDVGALISKLASRISTEKQIATLNELNAKEGGIKNITSSINDGISFARENLLWYNNYSIVINSKLNEAIRIIEDKSPASTVVANNWVVLMTVFSLIVYIIS